MRGSVYLRHYPPPAITHPCWEHPWLKTNLEPSAGENTRCHSTLLLRKSEQAPNQKLEAEMEPSQTSAHASQVQMDPQGCPMPFGCWPPCWGSPQNITALPLLPSHPTPTCCALRFWPLHQSLGTSVGTGGDRALPHRASRISSVCLTQEPEGLTAGVLPQSAWEERSSRGWVPAPAGNHSRIEAGKGEKKN